MPAREILPHIYQVGSIDWDIRMFDELIPLPYGTSYNSYLIRGSKKTALIDTVDIRKTDELLANLEKAAITTLDYIIANHAEQDHAGTIPELLQLYPEAKIVTNTKCQALLMNFMSLQESKFKVVGNGDTLSLGDKVLEFIITPWVHWPETMFTYLRKDKILFPCDFLGSHFATSDLFVRDKAAIYLAAKRYYAQIMMPFRPTLKKHLNLIEDLEIDIIAPSHGPVYDDPAFITDLYKDWSSETVKNEVVLPYISMHGSTAVMVDYFTGALMERGIAVKPFNLTKTDTGELAMALVDAATVVIATPAVLTGAHPAVVSAAYLTNALRPKTKFISIISSYGWGCRLEEQLKGMLGNLKTEFLDPVTVKGFPKKETFVSLDQLADKILLKHKNIIK